jgi:hypothetical protein
MLIELGCSWFGFGVFTVACKQHQKRFINSSQVLRRLEVSQIAHACGLPKINAPKSWDVAFFDTERYIAPQLEWIKYHEVVGGGHTFAFANEMENDILKALLKIN